MAAILNIDLDAVANVYKDQDFFKGGSYGSVQRILWKKKECAVKYFRKRENFQKNYSEVYNLFICNHDNIVKLFGAGPNLKEQKLYYYVMEFANNGSLDELLHELNHIDYSLAQGLNWLWQCTKAVKYLHTNFPHPILHRDIKPANLLLFGRGTLVKLCDFGTVKSVQNTENTAESGTFIYMAPEVMDAVKERSANYNEKCDIYSLAIIMWEVLTRQKPFKNTPNVYSIITKVVVKNERLEEIPDCPPRLQKLIKCCWRKKYKERPNSTEVCRVLEIILRQMDNADKPLPIDCYAENHRADDLSAETDSLNDNEASMSESFNIQMDLIDDGLKPSEPLPSNVESEMIYEQHRSLLQKFVDLNLECQRLELEKNSILYDIAADSSERDRIKRYCELKIKQEQQIHGAT